MMPVLCFRRAGIFTHTNENTHQMNDDAREIRDGHIPKDRSNLHHRYYFGASMMFTTNPGRLPLAESGILVIPRMLSRTCERFTERQSGNQIFSVVVEAEFDFTAIDGSKLTARNYGEAMDSGDNATNKAMSAAYKYAIIEILSIPVEGESHRHGSETRRTGARDPSH